MVTYTPRHCSTRTIPIFLCYFRRFVSCKFLRAVRLKRPKNSINPAVYVNESLRCLSGFNLRAGLIKISLIVNKIRQHASAQRPSGGPISWISDSYGNGAGGRCRWLKQMPDGASVVGQDKWSDTHPATYLAVIYRKVFHGEFCPYFRYSVFISGMRVVHRRWHFVSVIRGIGWQVSGTFECLLEFGWGIAMCFEYQKFEVLY